MVISKNRVQRHTAGNYCLPSHNSDQSATICSATKKELDFSAFLRFVKFTLLKNADYVAAPHNINDLMKNSSKFEQVRYFCIIVHAVEEGVSDLKAPSKSVFRN